MAQAHHVAWKIRMLHSSMQTEDILALLIAGTAPLLPLAALRTDAEEGRL